MREVRYSALPGRIYYFNFNWPPLTDEDRLSEGQAFISRL
jgi:hypothetical protein